MSTKKKSADPNVKKCANCDTIGANLTCAKCKSTDYCSKACQIQHWKKGHKEHCVTPEKRRPQTIASKGLDGNSQILRGAEEDGGDSRECLVCLDSLSGGGAVCTLSCKHEFHQECVNQLRMHGVQQVCPLCRAALSACPEKLFEDATRMFVAVFCQVENGREQSWQSLTNSQKRKMDMVIDTCTSAAMESHADAQYLLGNAMYLYGNGVAGDHKKAAEWFHKAADQGHAGAQCSLGKVYRDGDGVGQDFKKALHWLRKAADQGVAKAQLILAGMYRLGEGVTQNLEKAVQWYHKAADQGHVRAQYNLAVMYHDGKGVGQDFKKALHWVRKAADQGLAQAQFNLAGMFRLGEGVAQDHKKAAQWYHKAADQGSADSLYYLAVMHHCGEGVSKDHKEAWRWLQKAADEGHAFSRFFLSCVSLMCALFCFLCLHLLLCVLYGYNT